jgi:ubiquinone/menaquinone biosynthesis C-methylase UbiE
MRSNKKFEVKDYWENKVCGAVYGGIREEGRVNLDKMAKARYELEPFILPFVDFPAWKGKRILEIGVGGGVDFSGWVFGGADATGIDLTEAGVQMTRQRLKELGLSNGNYRLAVADAENLAFPDETFDLVYSWGVLHHSPDTPKAFREACRVTKRGGEFRGLIYHAHCWVGLMFWFRYSLLTARPWKSPRQAMFEHLESPGTKTYTKRETEALLRGAGFKHWDIRFQLSIGDLLTNTPRDKYRSPIYKLVWRLYPRWFVKMMGNRWGLGIMIKAYK